MNFLYVWMKMTYILSCFIVVIDDGCQKSMFIIAAVNDIILFMRVMVIMDEVGILSYCQ